MTQDYFTISLDSLNFSEAGLTPETEIKFWMHGFNLHRIL